MKDPTTELEAGIDQIQRFLTGHGLRFTLDESGPGSGGPFARGSIVAGECRVSLSYRFGLGDISLHAEGKRMKLKAYLREVGGYFDAKYPAARSGSLEQFPALAHDLAAFCSEFINGDASRFLAAHRAATIDPDKWRGVRGLPD